MSHFSGEANCARCLAHIVNLVAKIILHQFDMPKMKIKKNNTLQNSLELPNEAGGNKMVVDENDKEMDDFDDKTDRVLYKEEREMDEGDSDDEDSGDGERLQRDAEIMEEVMEGEIEWVVKKVKPVHQAIFKVSLFFFF